MCVCMNFVPFMSCGVASSVEDLSCNSFHIFCSSVIFLMYTDVIFHFSRVIMSQGNDVYKLKLQTKKGRWAALNISGKCEVRYGLIAGHMFEQLWKRDHRKAIGEDLDGWFPQLCLRRSIWPWLFQTLVLALGTINWWDSAA